MGLSSDLRVRIRDYAAPSMDSDFQQRFDDTQLDVFLRDALNELNRWANSNHTVVSLDAALAGSPSNEERGFYHLTQLLAQIRILEADATSPDDYVKFMTQDTTIDPGDASLRIKRLLDKLVKDFEKKLDHWIGVEHGRWLWVIDPMNADTPTEF